MFIYAQNLVETFVCEYLFYENKICLSNPLALTSFRGKCNTNSREKWVFYFKSLRKEYYKNKIYDITPIIVLKSD